MVHILECESRNRCELMLMLLLYSNYFVIRLYLFFYPTYPILDSPFTSLLKTLSKRFIVPEGQS